MSLDFLPPFYFFPVRFFCKKVNSMNQRVDRIKPPRLLSPPAEGCPDCVARNKILPQLINAFEYSNAGSAILAPVFKIGKKLDSKEYQARPTRTNIFFYFLLLKSQSLLIQPEGVLVAQETEESVLQIKKKIDNLYIKLSKNKISHFKKLFFYVL